MIQTMLYLGIEGGATRSRALLVDRAGKVRMQLSGGPGNVRLLSDAALVGLLKSFKAAARSPVSIAIGMAGARTAQDFARIRKAAARIWPQVPCYATNDLETALLAADPHPGTKVQVLVLSGTGSCCFARNQTGKVAKVGGWGHILGDKGSGYEIGLRGLKASVYYYDRDAKWPKLGERLLRALMLNDPNELIPWVQHATKDEIAALAVEVFEASKERDKIANDILEAAAASLAEDGVACARRLATAGTFVQFVLAGSVLLKQPAFQRSVANHIRKLWPKSKITPVERESVWGAVELARRSEKFQISNFKSDQLAERHDEELTRTLVASPTEQRNPRSMKLDKLTIRGAIELMLSEDEKIPNAIRAQARSIEKAIRHIVRSLQRGGRLFYVGAGTSGRLGVLDASECPPTFRTPPEMVQGIIAGGQRALWQAVEGAEDDPDAGAAAVQFRGIARKDVIVGIAASGRTPFVWGALDEARRRGAMTVLITFNPNLKIEREHRPDVVIAPEVGPEILTGSTRLKAGTATKLILNMFTTVAMVRLGKVLSNLMIDVKASNTKLRDRATRIVQQLTGISYARARQALEKNGWDIKRACGVART